MHETCGLLFGRSIPEAFGRIGLFNASNSMRHFELDPQYFQTMKVLTGTSFPRILAFDVSHNHLSGKLPSFLNSTNVPDLIQSNIHLEVRTSMLKTSNCSVCGC